MDWQKMDAAPKDGTKILIWDKLSGPNVVYWMDGFGWTYDGGDTFDPLFWCPVKPPEGQSSELLAA